jgi:hypothetical protein
MKGGKSKADAHTAAVNYAEKVIYETHGDYSATNAPRFMRSGVTRLMTQFRKFQLIQASHYVRLINQAFKGAKPEDRALAMKVLAFNFGTMTALGGVMALPGFAVLSMLTGALFGDGDEPDNAEATLRRMIGDKEIADLIHAAGGYFYCDGANFNAIVGKVRPGDLGVDAMHINLHKTFSTPHGGGGPGSGPVVLSEALAPYAPLPFVRKDEGGTFYLVEEENREERGPSFGRMTAFHGQMGMYVRAYAYMLSHGADGLRQAAEDAVLNANYIKARLSGVMSAAFPDGPCMHEALFDDRWLEGTGITTLDFAKAMIDEGFHPMTMYFPLVVHGAMLIEPTESESKASLDLFIAALRDLAFAAKRGDVDRFKGAPYHAPRRRLDETRAARKPVLKWTAPEPERVAAE